MAAYAYTGQDATLKVARSLVCAAGSYTYTGVAATIKVVHSLVCSPGSYTYTGLAAEFGFAHRLTCDTGAYAYTGNEATLGYVAGASSQSGVSRLNISRLVKSARPILRKAPYISIDWSGRQTQTDIHKTAEQSASMDSVVLVPVELMSTEQVEREIADIESAIISQESILKRRMALTLLLMAA